jgi:uncharacterized protein (TIGR00369 family)
MNAWAKQKDLPAADRMGHDPNRRFRPVSARDPCYAATMGKHPMTESFRAAAAGIRATLEGQGFTRLLGAEVVSVDPGVVVMALDRRPELLQQNGLFHGGVIAYLIDNATTAAAGTMIDRSKRAVITAEYKINLVAPSTGDRLTCRAEVVKPGRSLTVVDAKVHCRTDGAEKLVAVALATIANLDRKPGNAS